MSAPPLPQKRRATLDDLMRFKGEGKAELIHGEIVPIMGSGNLPGIIAVYIVWKLVEFAEQREHGIVHGDGTIYAVPELSSGREAFVPDVAYLDRQRSTATMKYVTGAPDFAAEIRSESDYGRTAERDMAAKRADYFEAGTRIVWDVDPVAKTVTAYTKDDPIEGVKFGLGETVTLGDVLPGWSLSLDWLFR